MSVPPGCSSVVAPCKVVEEHVAVLGIVGVLVASTILQQDMAGHAHLRGESGGLAGVVRLRRALRHHHVGALRDGLGHQEFEVWRVLLPPGGHAGAIRRALIQISGAAQRVREAVQPLQRVWADAQGGRAESGARCMVSGSCRMGRWNSCIFCRQLTIGGATASDPRIGRQGDLSVAVAHRRTRQHIDQIRYGPAPAAQSLGSTCQSSEKLNTQTSAPVGARRGEGEERAVAGSRGISVALRPCSSRVSRPPRQDRGDPGV